MGIRITVNDKNFKAKEYMKYFERIVCIPYLEGRVTPWMKFGKITGFVGSPDDDNLKHEIT